MEKVGDFWWPKGFNAGHDICYDTPKEKAAPLIPGNVQLVMAKATKKVFEFSVRVPAKFAGLYGTELSRILKRERLSWEMIETSVPLSTIQVKMLVEPAVYESIKREIESTLGLTVKEETE